MRDVRCFYSNTKKKEERWESKQDEKAACLSTDVDKEDVHIGMPVEMVTRKLRSDGEEGMIVYGYKFRPAIATQPA